MKVNGFPKSGNHALVKACKLLGQTYLPLHLPYTEKTPDKYLFIKRDPRNVLLSVMRWEKHTRIAPDTYLALFHNYLGQPFSEALGQYEGWLSDPDTLVIKYEDLVTSDKTMRQIADYLEVPYVEGAFEQLPGDTHTWNDVHSDYHTIWTPEVWTELLTTWGY